MSNQKQAQPKMKFVKMRIINESNELAWGLVEVPESAPGIAIDPRTVQLNDAGDKVQSGKIPEGGPGITVKGVFGVDDGTI